MKRAVVFVNGNLSNFSRAKEIINKQDYLIAVDGGVKHVLKLGLIPQTVIGDFDSISQPLQKKMIKMRKERFKPFPTTLIKYPVKKNKTDFELAIDYCLEKKFREIIIFGIFGDRIDHFTANIFLLAKTQTENKSVKIKIIEGSKEIYILDKKIVINGQIGDELSIIPINKLEGITTEGLYYRLIDNTLSFGSTRGVSNVMNKNMVKITAKNGIALIVHLRKKDLRNNK